MADFRLWNRLGFGAVEVVRLTRDESSRTTAFIRILDNSCEVWKPPCPSKTVKKSKSPGAEGSVESLCMIACECASSIGSLDAKAAVVCFQTSPPGLGLD